MDHQQRMSRLSEPDMGRLQSILLVNWSERLNHLQEENERLNVELSLWEQYCRTAWNRVDEFNTVYNERGYLLDTARAHLTEALDERDNLLDLLSRICHENKAIHRMYDARIRAITGTFETTEDIVDLTQ